MVGNAEFGNDLTNILLYMCQVFRLPNDWMEHLSDESDIMSELRSVWKAFDTGVIAQPEFAPEPISFDILEGLIGLLEHPTAHSDDIEFQFGKLIYYLKQESNYNSMLLKALLPHYEIYEHKHDEESFMRKLLDDIDSVKPDEEE